MQLSVAVTVHCMACFYVLRAFKGKQTSDSITEITHSATMTSLKGFRSILELDWINWNELSKNNEH